MEYTIQLPEEFTTKDIRSLLEEDWLVPRKVRHFLRVRKNVFVKGVATPFHQTVKASDMITLLFEENDYPVPHLLLGDKNFIVPLYEDDHIIVVDKPVGIKTHPNQPDEKDTLLNHLADYLHEKKQIPYVVHRLDKETSGVILFAKNPFILPILGRMLERKEIQRCYHARVKGKIHTLDFIINKKIGRDRHDRRKRIVDARNGQVAITHVHVVKQLIKETYIECLLETGRTHQIRVHLADMGHPVLGDPLYHPYPEQENRLMLHAHSLSLFHPFTKKQIHCVSTNNLWE